MKVMMAAMMVMLGAREDMIDPRNAAFWSSLSNQNFPKGAVSLPMSFDVTYLISADRRPLIFSIKGSSQAYILMSRIELRISFMRATLLSDATTARRRMIEPTFATKAYNRFTKVIKMQLKKS